MLRAESRYGLKRGDVIELELVQRKGRTTVFFDPPLRHIELFNEDWKEITR